jgi:hypothetical protein
MAESGIAHADRTAAHVGAALTAVVCDAACRARQRAGIRSGGGRSSLNRGRWPHLHRRAGRRSHVAQAGHGASIWRRPSDAQAGQAAQAGRAETSCGTRTAFSTRKTVFRVVAPVIATPGKGQHGKQGGGRQSRGEIHAEHRRQANAERGALQSRKRGGARKSIRLSRAHSGAGRRGEEVAVRYVRDQFARPYDRLRAPPNQQRAWLSPSSPCASTSALGSSSLRSRCHMGQGELSTVV